MHSPDRQVATPDRPDRTPPCTQAANSLILGSAQYTNSVDDGSASTTPILRRPRCDILSVWLLGVAKKPSAEPSTKQVASKSKAIRPPTIANTWASQRGTSRQDKSAACRGLDSFLLCVVCAAHHPAQHSTHARTHRCPAPPIRYQATVLSVDARKPTSQSAVGPFQLQRSSVLRLGFVGDKRCNHCGVCDPPLSTALARGLLTRARRLRVGGGVGGALLYCSDCVRCVGWAGWRLMTASNKSFWLLAECHLSVAPPSRLFIRQGTWRCCPETPLSLEMSG